MDKIKSCPSAPFKKGNSVFGVFKEDQFSFTDTLIPITEAIIDEKSNTGEFRSTMKCVTKGCINWNGQKCTVPDQMAYFFDPISDISHLENCPIQSSCRWYHQDGEKACAICPLIKTKPFGK